MQGSKRAKSLRQQMTSAETQLWHRLRDRRLGKYKFRRQVPVGPYVADFLCLSIKLIVEVDGGQHAERIDYDQQRTRYLEGEGYLVLRYWNNDVLINMEGVLEALTLALSQRERELELSLSHRNY